MNDWFEDIIARNKYAVFNQFGTFENAIILVADVHSITVRKRNNGLLKECLKNDDCLFLEGYYGGIAYSDLQKQFFEEARISLGEQIYFKTIAVTHNSMTDEDEEWGYFRQGFPCRIASSEDDVLHAASKHALTEGKRCLESYFWAKKEEERIFWKNELLRWKETFVISLEYRNRAMARTLRQEREQGVKKIYQIVGAGHVLMPEQVTTIETSIHKTISEQSDGGLCILLEQEQIQYIVIGPSNISKEVEHALQHPEDDVEADQQ